MALNILTRLQAEHDPVTRETFFRGKWHQEEDFEDLLEAIDRYEYEKEEYKRPPRSLTLSEAELYYGDDEEGKESS